ncbi:hypothetical protein SpCBS45565_g02931 [Spizellomyces sp. 'palustris']|nr:hypothetical protein SpCBS45565_g02931 [Spizellomyces sp. 'palustris']
MAGGPLHELGMFLKKIGFKKIKKFLQKVFHDQAAQAPPTQQQQQQQPQQQYDHQPYPAPDTRWNQSQLPGQVPHPQQGHPPANGAWSHGPPHIAAPPQQQHAAPAPQLSTYPASSQAVAVPQPTPHELANLADAVARLWELDANRLEPGRDFTLNLQNATKVYAQVDASPAPLFANVSPELLRRFPTYVLFMALLDNYHAQNGIAESVTAEEIKEQHAFIEELLKTAPIQYCHRYLAAKALAPANLGEFKQLLKSIWFDLYKRQTANDSSAFEHTFVGELKAGQGVLGFHNWIQFFLEERKRTVDYRGYILPRRRNGGGRSPEYSHVLSFQFSWHGEVKPVSTFFIGTSPEFEIALYTLMFLTGQENNVVYIEDTEVSIKCHKFQSARGLRLGSCYPVSG